MTKVDIDVTYVGESDGDYFSLYHMLADGGRPVMEILVDPDDQIWICGTTGLSIPQQTVGTAHRHRDDDLAPIIGEVNATTICLGSIMAYVRPRALDLMARVYCPVNDNVKGQSSG